MHFQATQRLNEAAVRSNWVCNDVTPARGGVPIMSRFSLHRNSLMQIYPQNHNKDLEN